ncbi:UbiA family prenyltransferase [Geoglobus acetivorans]|uniref:UbiA prenyltransferase n=1 Tax=Geoglobus acetivorans TaxID=565033 RepID=A0A0A7GI54_GEOAI|nr:UbiA prenyltransferase [Geoglobus acetivorans]
MKAGKAIWELTRLEHGFIYGLGVVAGAYIALGEFDFRLSFFGFFTALFLQASAFALNDYFDYDVDVANKRFDRPLVRGELNKRDALIIAAVFAVPGFIFACLISIPAFLLALGITVLGYAYDVKLKEFGLAGNAYIAFSMAAPFIFGGVVAGNLNSEILLLSSIAFLSGLAREIMKGIEDIEGDALRDVKTLARMYGAEKASRVSAFLFITAILLSFAVMLIPEYADIKYLIPVAICDVLLLDSAKKLISGVGTKDIRSLRKKTMIALLFGLIGFLLGAA